MNSDIEFENKIIENDVIQPEKIETHDLNEFDNILLSIEQLYSIGHITENIYTAQKFILNRMRYYHTKILPETYLIFNYSMFLNYIPKECRRFFLRITPSNEKKRRGALSELCLWSWFSGFETTKKSNIYIVSEEPYNEMGKLVSTEKTEQLRDISYEIYTREKIMKEKENPTEREIAIIDHLKEQRVKLMCNYIFSVFTSLTFFNTLKEAKDFIISKSNCYVFFKNPVKAREEQKSRFKNSN